MLQIRDISKAYKTGTLVQQALDHVSLNLRDSEFVAILGPSGSGKTTLLNVIGGLDRYDSGDLVINGTSTKRYKDRDWDSYRNHTVGFVFQSYNLIMHQTVLANVELALTISGVSAGERRARAKEALAQVGLAEQMHKKPNQMSGGQMQRVAIARALVNDPDIVLADEPTGALDSETSEQVMGLLKEVAKDRLVVMVTHNPDLADRYATRIVRISDGRIAADTDPYVVQEQTEAVHRNLGRAAMNFATALSLSFNNLRTKKARTFLVSFAGSIGIIGIALIMALSSGANRYIKTQESESLAQYPLEIAQTGFDLSAMLGGGDSGGSLFGAADEQAVTDAVGVQEVAETMFDGVANNDLGAFKAFLDSRQSDIGRYTNAVEYDYDVTPLIFREDGDRVRQLHPNNFFRQTDGALTTSGSGQSGRMGMMSGMGQTLFYQLPQQTALYERGYDVKVGRWPQNSRELVLVLSEDGKVSDLLLYALGVLDETRLEQMVEDFTAGRSVSKEGGTAAGSAADKPAAASARSESAVSASSEAADGRTFPYSDFLGKTFRRIDAADLVTYDKEYKVWTDRSGDADLVRRLVKEGETLQIVGIVQPREDVSVHMLNTGINYPYGLLEETMAAAAKSGAVQAQLSDSQKDIFTGKPFGEKDANEDLDLSRLFRVDEDALRQAFSAGGGAGSPDLSALGSGADLSALFNGAGAGGAAGAGAMSGLDLSSLDLGSLISPSALSAALPDLADIDWKGILDTVQLQASKEQLAALFQDVLSGYEKAAAEDPAADGTKLFEGLRAYLDDAATQQMVQEKLKLLTEQALAENGAAAISEADLQELLGGVVTGYAAYAKEKELDPSDVQHFTQYLQDPESGAQAAVQQLAAAVQERVRARLSQLSFSAEQLAALSQALMEGYGPYAKAHELPQPEKVAEAFGDYLTSDEVQQTLRAAASDMIDTSGLATKLQQALQQTMGAVTGALTAQLQAAVQQISGQISAAVGAQIQQAMAASMQSAMGQLASGGEGLFSFDSSALANAVQMNMTAAEVQELLGSMMSGEQDTYETNLQRLGFAEEESPSAIRIYSKDFDARGEVVNMLDKYNDDQIAAGAEEKKITYTDMVAAMMESVTKIIDAISYILIAFVAISLVVSSIMIGVITYISVLERRKEIGILRAIGASKHNIAQVFNAETFITGLLAGLIGVVVTVVLTFPINSLIQRVTGEAGIRAALPIGAAAGLILLSTVLTMLAGLLPSRKAAKSDPVKALREN